MTEDRNRTTVRRALRAGAVVGASIFVLGVLLTAEGGIEVPIVIIAALSAATFANAGWLLVAYLLDVIAGDPPDGRRTAWTVASVVVAMFGPFVLLGAVAGGSGVAR